ncbi:MAG: hypothetical protein NVSMB12_07650 [Acidimicrobiales bacterium]
MDVMFTLSCAPAAGFGSVTAARQYASLGGVVVAVVEVVRGGAAGAVVAMTTPWNAGAVVVVDGPSPFAADVDVVGAGTVVKNAVSDGDVVAVVLVDGLAVRNRVRA